MNDTMTDTERRALEMIKSNAGIRSLLPAGHAALNAGVPGLLRMGLIEHAPARAAAYRLTPAGRAALDSL